MFCPKCGTALPDGAKFCASCGTSLDTDATVQVAAPAPQPVQQYTQPVAPAPQPMPAEPQYTYYPTQPNYVNPGPAPSYNAVPQGTKVARYPVFPFLAAGSMIMTIVMLFLPWLKIYRYQFTLMDISDIERYFSSEDAAVFTAFLAIYVFGLAFLIPEIIMAFTKRHLMPIGFTIASSVIILLDIVVYLIAVGEVDFVDITAAPVFALIFAILNIIFNAFARKVKYQ